MMRVLMSILIALQLTNCGDKASGDKATDEKSASDPANSPGQNKSYTRLIEEGELVPECTPDNQSELIYVLDDSEFQVCKDSTWTAVDTTGPKGNDGAAGAPGADGTANIITDSIYCGGQIDTTDYRFTYNAALMSSGDMFVTGSISNPRYETGRSKFYSKDQNGAANGSVIVTHDASATDNYGWWNLTLNRDTLVVTNEYNDSEVSGGKLTYTMDPTDCVVNSYE